MTNDPSSLVLKPTGLARRVLTYAMVLVLGLALVAVGRAPIPGLIVLAVAAAIYVALYIRLGARHLVVDHRGVEVRGLRSTRRMAWAEIERYSFVSTDPNAGARYGIGGVGAVLVFTAIKALSKAPPHRTFKAGRLLLRGRAGTLKVGARYKDVDQALERIFAELHPRLSAGVEFGELSFDGVTLHHRKKGALPLIELEKIVVGPLGTITLRKIGKRLAWATVSMARVDNPLLLFERLAERSAVIEMDNGVFLPLPTQGLLARVTAMRTSLPQARVQKR